MKSLPIVIRARPEAGLRERQFVEFVSPISLLKDSCHPLATFATFYVVPRGGSKPNRAKTKPFQGYSR